MDVWKNEQYNGSMDYVNEWMSIHSLMDEWMNEWMDEWAVQWQYELFIWINDKYNSCINEWAV